MTKIVLAGLLLATSTATAGGGDLFAVAPVFDQSALEAKLDTFGDGPGPDALAMLITNDGVVNQLYAVRIPPPYDGTGTTMNMADSGATLFALGDICRDDGVIVVPYIKDFNVRVARFDGNWTTTTIPDSVSHSFTSADCVITTDGWFVSAQDFNDSDIDIFQSIDSGVSFSWYGQFGDGQIRSPFDGAVRDQLVARGPGFSQVISVHQRNDGMMQVTEFHTNVASPGSFESDPFFALSPPASFTVVRESAAARARLGYLVSFNGDDDAVLAHFPYATPRTPTLNVLGSINSNGAQFGFQGGSVVPASGPGRRHRVIWSDLYKVAENGSATTVPNYPAAHIGGPVDGCRTDRSSGGRTPQIRLLIPRVGSPGTDLATVIDPTEADFIDGFESGDTSSWSCKVE